MNKLQKVFSNILIHIMIPLCISLNIAMIIQTQNFISSVSISTMTLIMLYIFFLFDGFQIHNIIHLSKSIQLSLMGLVEESYKDNLSNLIDMKTELIAVKKLDGRLLYKELDCIIKILDNKINFRKAEINENVIIETEINKN